MSTEVFYTGLLKDYIVTVFLNIIPARVRKPKDKPSVESGVGWLETLLLEWLKNKLYYRQGRWFI